MTGILHFYSTVILLFYLPALVSCIRTTGGKGGGEDCVFPYIYQGHKYFACISANYDRPWCSVTSNYDADKRWGNCESPDIATIGGTANGAKCYFPYKFLGGDKYECIPDYHDQLWCGTTRNYDQDKKWGNCGATAMRTTEGNSYGAPCCFPFMYRGVEFTGCTGFDSRYRKAWCSTTPDFDDDEQWGYCMIKTTGGNSGGANCVFPFFYNGKEYGRCLINPELQRFRPWCSTTYHYNSDRKWGYCIMQTTHTCKASRGTTVLPGVSTTIPSIVSTTILPQTQRNTCVYSQRLEDTNARGGVPSSGARSVQECMRQCDDSLECFGLDWDTNPNPRSRCWHHFDVSNFREENIGVAPGVYHYRVMSCTGKTVDTCRFEQRNNTNSFGAAGLPEVTRPDQCRTQCVINKNCVAYEWESSPNPNNNLQCFIHTSRDAIDGSSTSRTVTQFVKLC